MESAVPAIHVAIVGAGPSGFYAAEALLRSGLPVRVDMIERLPTPFGLVRSGVAALRTVGAREIPIEESVGVAAVIVHGDHDRADQRSDELQR